MRESEGERVRESEGEREGESEGERELFTGYSYLLLIDLNAD